MAIVQSREQYMRGTDAAEWSGGHYDGRIHIAWSGGSDARPRMERALAHEMVHACLMSIPSGASSLARLVAGRASAETLGRYASIFQPRTIP